MSVEGRGTVAGCPEAGYPMGIGKERAARVRALVAESMKAFDGKGEDRDAFEAEAKKGALATLWPELIAEDPRWATEPVNGTVIRNKDGSYNEAGLEMFGPKG
ncbi:MAG: hypothetical protein ACRBCT_05750 [Alphaproteobacteria bacterium]